MHTLKRPPLGDLTNEAQPPARRLRSNADSNGASDSVATSLGTTERLDEDVAIQRFSLVSRRAPRTRRLQAQRSVLVPPPALASRLGSAIRVCRCSECLPSRWRKENVGILGPAGEPLRICRQDTEKHLEYELLLDMSGRFQAARHGSGENISSLATEACYRQISAYFILGGDSARDVIGYVAAQTNMNRRVSFRNVHGRRPVATAMQASSAHVLPSKPASRQNPAEQAEDVPVLLQIWLEPEFRGRGFATAALARLLRGHEALYVEDPNAAVSRALARLDFTVVGTDGPTTFFRKGFLNIDSFKQVEADAAAPQTVV